MDYTSARSGGPFAVLPQDIILREIVPRLTIPEAYSLRCATNTILPYKALPALFVHWVLLPRVRVFEPVNSDPDAQNPNPRTSNPQVGPMISAYDIAWCLEAGIVARNPFTEWCLGCKPLTQRLSLGILGWNKYRGARIPELEPCVKGQSEYTIPMMVGAAMLCRGRKHVLELVNVGNAYDSQAMLLCMGVTPPVKDTRVLDKLPRSSMSPGFVLNDALVARYAVSIPEPTQHITDSLAHLWHARLPDDPAVYRVLLAADLSGQLVQVHSEVDRVIDVLLGTCYACRKITFWFILDCSSETLVGYLRHRVEAHAQDKLVFLYWIPLKHTQAVINFPELFVRAYEFTTLITALR